MEVLVGIDGSDGGFRALERAVGRAVEAGDDLTVAIVETAGGDSPTEIEERVREVVREAGLEPAGGEPEEPTEQPAPRRTGVEIRRLAGAPGPRLVEVAEREGFDRLVVSGGSRSPMGKISLEPVVEYVLLNANVTVTLVR